MKTDIRRDVLGRLKTALAAIDLATAEARLQVSRKQRVFEATADARLQVARLEREIERVEIEEGSR
jgi:hypothetical protein